MPQWDDRTEREITNLQLQTVRVLWLRAAHWIDAAAGKNKIGEELSPHGRRGALRLAIAAINRFDRAVEALLQDVYETERTVAGWKVTGPEQSTFERKHPPKPRKEAA